LQAVSVDVTVVENVFFDVTDEVEDVDKVFVTFEVVVVELLCVDVFELVEVPVSVRLIIAVLVPLEVAVSLGETTILKLNRGEDVTVLVAFGHTVGKEDNDEVLLCVVVLLSVELDVPVLVELTEPVSVLLIIAVILRLGLLEGDEDDVDVLEFETLLVNEVLAEVDFVPLEVTLNDGDELDVFDDVDVVVPVLVEELDLVVNGEALYVFVVNDDTVMRGLDEDVLLTIDDTDEIFVGILVFVTRN